MTQLSDTIGVLLAGGRSTRLGGGDKCLLELGGKTLLDWTIERLGPQVPALVLNANGDARRFAAFGLPVVADCCDARIGDYPGPLAGVLAGMNYAKEKMPKATAIITVATDTPFLPLDLAARLLAASDNDRLAVARSATGVHPVFALWPLALAEELRRDLESGQRRVSEWVKRKNAVEVDFPPQPIGDRSIDPFFNINRPEDLAEAERLLTGGTAVR